MYKITRREVLAGMGVALSVPASSWPVTAAARPAGARPVVAPRARVYRFFDAAEARFIEAACERLIPADASGPGALDAGVPGYLDRHLAGAWGAGQQLYRNGPWQPGTPPQGQSPPGSPAEFFRAALGAIHRDLEQHGLPYGAAFNDLSAAAQDAYLRSLEAGATDLGGVQSAVFFDMLLAMTVEGFFSDQRHGSSRDRVRWRMRGFPGAHAGESMLPGGGSRRQEAAGNIP